MTRRDVRSRITAAGFTPQTVQTPDGATISYGEGPAGGPPLLLIHGQTTDWTDYVDVLGPLAADWHVFAVDCFGHGGSTKDPALYPARPQGAALRWFLESIVGDSAVVSGHSSGGLLAAWLAAQAPELVASLLIEDAPLFATEPDRAPSTFAWLDSFAPMHDFLRLPPNTMRWTRYWVRNSYLRTFFGDKGWARLVQDPVEARLDRAPDAMPRLWWLPKSMNDALALTACVQDGTGGYDLRYGEMIYDGTWFDGFDQGQTLTRVTAPTTLLHTAVRERDGVLLGAMTSDDARRAADLIPDCLLIDDIASGHNIHREKPRLFVEAIGALRSRRRP